MRMGVSGVMLAPGFVWPGGAAAGGVPQASWAGAGDAAHRAAPTGKNHPARASKCKNLASGPQEPSTWVVLWAGGAGPTEVPFSCCAHVSVAQSVSLGRVPRHPRAACQFPSPAQGGRLPPWVTCPTPVGCP